MSEEAVVREEKEEPKLKLLPGGRDDNSWFVNMEKRTVFLCRPKTSQDGRLNMHEGLAQLMLMDRTDSGKASQLYDVINGNTFMVDTIRFQGKMDLFEVLGIVGEPTKEEEENNNNDAEQS